MLNITIGHYHPFSPKVLEFALRKYTSVPLDIRHQQIPTWYDVPADWKDHEFSVYLDSSVICTSDPRWLYDMFTDFPIQMSADMKIGVFNNRMYAAASTIRWFHGDPWTRAIKDQDNPAWDALVTEMLNSK